MDLIPYLLVAIIGMIAAGALYLVSQDRKFKAERAAKEAASEIVVKEGIHGYFSYHLAERSKPLSLCGRAVMTTNIPMSAWGTKTELHERWCPACVKELERIERPPSLVRQPQGKLVRKLVRKQSLFDLFRDRI